MVFHPGANALPPWSVGPTATTGEPPALGDLLAAPAVKWPERAAIDDGTDSYTFARLERAATAVAALLAARGVGPGDRVVVLTEKRSATAALAVAVWKCGAVYVPLDAAEPEARLRGLLTRLAPKLVVSLGEREPLVPGLATLGGAELAGPLAGPEATHATVAHRPEDIAYIVFASSPTGEPQGAEIAVESLYAHFRGHNEVLRITADSRVLSLTPFHFDVSLLDTLLPLSVGAFVHQFRSLPAGAVMRSVLAKQQITHLIAVTMLLTMITGDGRQITPAKLPALRLVMTGAQVCDADLLRIWTRQLPQTRLVQAFGPPEATIFGFSYEAEPSAVETLTGAGPVGRPLGEVRARLVRGGVEVREAVGEGELWVGGPQVMRGYFDQPEETARVVVEADGVRWFRTGDICRRAADGTLTLVRHADERITWLAGRRTHLNELGRAAAACAGVDRAVTAVVRTAGRERIALVVAAKERRVLGEVAERLRVELPEYLRPGLLAWTPTDPAPADPAGAGAELIARLGAAAAESDSPCFALSADGTVEPIDEVELCLQ
ncbi:AMP-binding protein [Streptomyces sp. NPDC090025]|uniref:AMP-binding protein n=1 Tax=Streptomyces sp. NPDC090025 TaxID=3365922 RepID=UPI00383340BA